MGERTCSFFLAGRGGGRMIWWTFPRTKLYFVPRELNGRRGEKRMWVSVGAAPDNKLLKSPTGLSCDHGQSRIPSDS